MTKWISVLASRQAITAATVADGVQNGTMMTIGKKLQASSTENYKNKLEEKH
jgi:hypothetical protein